MSRESRREILAFFLLVIAAFLIVCVHSQDALDYLDGSGEIQNICGPAGATVSFLLTSWFGKAGAYGISTLLCIAGLVLFFQRNIEQWHWKITGGLLLVVAVCSFDVAVLDATGGADCVPGGYLGWSFYTFLLVHLSTVGTYLILTLITLTAFVISTDTILYPALARSQHALLNRKNWQSLAGLLKEKAPSPRWPRLAGLQRFLGRLSSKRDATSQKVGDHGKRRVHDLEGPVSARIKWRTGERLEDPAPEINDDDERDAEVHAVSAPGADGFVGRQTDCFTVQKSKQLRPRKSTPYKLPPVALIDRTPEHSGLLDKTALARTSAKIESTLDNFKIEAKVVEVQRGPTITQFELRLAAGIKVHKIVNLADDLAMALKAPTIRVIAPIPGKATVGVEVPNKTRSMVGLRELLEHIHLKDSEYSLPLALGRDIAGQPVIGDLGDMPHLLIAGSTGSGKSVCINSIITSFLMTRTPEEVKMILVDPKMVELAHFESIPHLLSPVVTDMKKAPAVFNWLVDRMDERYEVLALAGVRHISGYNALGPARLRKRIAGKVEKGEIDKVPEFLPYILVVIDELADLMMTAAKEVETSITRLSQKSRAVGIHVILATQRPSVDVITGLIKANMPSRISFRVTSRVDSRTILDGNGAEKLLGKGDMLFTPPGTSDIIRVQGTFISDKEIRDVVQFAARTAEPQYNPELTKFGIDGSDDDPEDEFYEDAVRIILGSQRGSVTLLQRQLQIGYTRASRLMEMTHERGLVGPFKGSKAREVYYTLEDWERQRGRGKDRADAGE